MFGVDEASFRDVGKDYGARLANMIEREKQFSVGKCGTPQFEELANFIG